MADVNLEKEKHTNIVMKILNANQTYVIKIFAKMR